MAKEQTWQYTAVPSFSGGENTDWAEDSLQPGQHLRLQNVDLNLQKGVQLRPGTLKVTASELVDSSTKVSSLVRYSKINGDKWLVAQSGTKVFTVNTATGAATEIASGLPTTAMKWLVYNDTLYGFNSEGADTGFHKWDGTTWTSNISGGGIPAKGFTGGIIHEDKLFAWGDEAHPSYLYFSNDYDPETFTVGDYLRFRDNDGDWIRGCAIIIGGQLLVLKDTSSWLVTGSDIDSFSKKLQTDDVGLVGNTLCAIDGRPIWLSQFGVVWYNPNSPILPFRNISQDKINGELLANSRAVRDAGVAHFWPKKNRYILSLPDATSPIAHVTHLEVVSYTQDGRPFKTFPWTRYTGITITCMAVADGAGDNGTLYYGSDDGHVYQFDSGTYTDA